MSRPPVRRSHIRRGLVEAASRRGLGGLTIQEIADAAGVSPGLLYRYWKGRDALAVEVYQTEYAALVARATAAMEGVVGARDRLRALVSAFLAFTEEEPTTLKFLLLSQHEMLERLPEGLGVTKLLGSLLREGQEEGVVREMDEALAVHLLLGLVLQPVVGSIYGDVRLPRGKLEEAIHDAIERCLLVQEAF